MITKIITDIEQARKAGLLKGGRYFIIRDNRTPMFLPIAYNNKIDIKTMTLYTGEDIKKNPKLPDYNDLIKWGYIKEANIFRGYDIDVEWFADRETAEDDNLELTDEIINNILLEFRLQEFNVTREALLHNYDAWRNDLKSGYRDDKNGYHLFTPCGCNTLSFRASRLCDDLDWQKTYMC